MKQATILVDKQGKQLTLGCRVAYASYKNLGMTFGSVTKLGRLRAEVTPEAPAFNTTPESFRSTELVRI